MSSSTSWTSEPLLDTPLFQPDCSKLSLEQAQSQDGSTAYLRADAIASAYDMHPSLGDGFMH